MRMKKIIYRILAWILCLITVTSLCYTEGNYSFSGNKAKAACDYDLPDEYPETGQKYWVIFREGFRNDRIEMSTCNITGNAEDACIEWDEGLFLKNGNANGEYNQYCLDENNWKQIGTYNIFTDYATSVIASNMDIYNAAGDLVLEKTDCLYPNSNSVSNGHIYKRYDKEMNWSDAKAYCESLGGYLVTITSSDEQKIVEDMLQDDSPFESYWMGAQMNDNQWEWITGETFDYAKWAKGEPNGHENGMCLQIYTRSSSIHITGGKGDWDDTWNDGDHADGIVEQGFICEWDSEDDIKNNGNKDDTEFTDMLTYEQYQAMYYSRNASFITDAYMTYSEIEDNYTPTQYALNNILSFGWNKKFGFTDDAQVWEVVILDILLKNGANDSYIEKWEKDSIKLSTELCEFIEKNNIADIEDSITFDVQNNLSEMINKIAGEGSDSVELSKIFKDFVDAAETVKDFVDMYSKYVELRKVVDTDMRAFLYEMKNTDTYRSIPAFQRALDKIIDNIKVDSRKFSQLILQETVSQEIVKKAVNMVVGTTVKLVLGERVYKLIDITKSSTIFLMDTICGTEELAQANCYLYMLDRIDDAAKEAFTSAAERCLNSNGKKAYSAVNGGLQFMINLCTYGIGVCRNWNEIISTDILSRMESYAPHLNFNKVHYDMVNDYFSLDHSSTKEEKKKFIEEKCKVDEKYVNVVLENQPAFAQIQWYHDSGNDDNEISCLVIFKVQNPNGHFTLHAKVVPKYTNVLFPKLNAKNGYITPAAWYLDSEYRQEADKDTQIKENTIFYTRYTKNILFEPIGNGSIRINSIKGVSTPVMEMKSFSIQQNNNCEIPAYIDGYKVTALGDDIFSECPHITSVSIPATIVTISDIAFKSLSPMTQFKYVEGSIAEKYLVNKNYKNTVSEQELVFKEKAVNINVGENKQLELEQKGSSVSETVYWSSSDSSIARVKNGLISGIKQGSVTISASTGAVSVTCVVNVVNKNQLGISDNNSFSSSKNTSNDVRKVMSVKVKKPCKTKIKSIKKYKKSLKIFWKKVKNIGGYQIQYSTSSKFKKAKIVTVRKSKTTVKKIKKLKPKKKYYVRIRTFIYVNGKYKYSEWSKKKFVRTR